MIAVYNEKNISKLEQVWNEIYASNPNHTPFQSYEYNIIAWTNLGSSGKLHVIALPRQDNHRLQAIFPCYLDDTGILRFINDIHTDFCGPLIHPDYEYDFQLYSELADYVLQTQEIKGFVFDNLKADSYLLSAFPYCCRGSIVRMTNAWSKVKIPSCHASELCSKLPSLAAKQRNELKKAIKEMQNASFHLYTIDKQPYPEKIINSLIIDMQEAGLRHEAYFSDGFKKLISDCYNAGVLSVSVVKENSVPVSAHLYYINNREIVDWVVLYTKGKCQTWNTLFTMQSLAETGGGVFNFARGLYDYKVKKFRPVMHNLYRISYSKSKLGQFVNWMECCKYYLKTILKPIIRRQK